MNNKETNSTGLKEFSTEELKVLLDAANKTGNLQASAEIRAELATRKSK